MTRLLPLLILVLLLAACTGTRSARAPTLLLIGYTDAGQGRLGVVQDTFLTDQQIVGRFLFLGSTALPTGQAPVSYDVSDRNDLRGDLFVLARAGNTPVSSVSVYPIGALTPEGDGLELTPRLVVDVAALPQPIPDAAVCPTRIQATQSGRYVALMHDLSLCDASNLNEAIDIVDLNASPPRVVRRLEASAIIPNALFMAQEDGADRLYYMSDESGGARLRVLRFPDLLDESTPALIPGSFKNDPNTVVRDLQLIGGDLIALQGSRFHAIRDPAGAATVGEPVPTSSGSLRLVPTNSPATPQVMVLSGNRFTVHTTPTDANPVAADLPLVDGTLEPVGGFVYLLSPGTNNLPLFDLREYDPAQRDLRPYLGTSFGVSQITNPVFVTWAQSILLPGGGQAP